MAQHRLLPLIMQIIVGVLVVTALGWAARTWQTRMVVKHLPPGWRILRPPSEACTLIAMDDMVWCGGKDGLTRLQRISGAISSPQDAAPSFPYVRALLRDRLGRIWLAHDGGVTRYVDHRWQQIAPGPSLSFRRASSLLETRDGAVWVGSRDEMARFDGAHWQKVTLPTGIASADVLLEDHEGSLWVGSMQFPHGGLGRYANGQWTLYSRSDGLPHPVINALHEDQQGTLWAAAGVANQGGLAYWRSGRWHVAAVPRHLHGVKMRSIYQDTHGRLWFGSEYDGIAVQDSGSWHSFTDKDGLAGYEVKAMIQDCDGVYWLATNTGISRIEQFAALDSQKAGVHDLP